MLKIVDLVYYCHQDYTSPQQVLEKHSRSLGFVDHIKTKVQYEVITHLNYEGKVAINNVPYTFFKRGNQPWQIPWKTHDYIRNLRPEIVLVHGFIFPLQVIMLKQAVGKSCRIILQHHGDKPAPSSRSFFQKVADRFVDAYLFTSLEQSKPWLDHKIIKDVNKCYEVLEASTHVKRKDKVFSKDKLGFKGNYNILWVGRLNANKDPFTVLKGFQKYLLIQPLANLYMVFQSNELLHEIKDFIGKNTSLPNTVHLVGMIPEMEIPYWYSAADIFVSGSQNEGSGYALIEAMHCGCIPVITNIPSFRQITSSGKYGLLFDIGNTDQLSALLDKAGQMSGTDYSKEIQLYALDSLSFEKIAEQVYDICESVVYQK
ncbi:MAG: glycosyltransferase family 4 protein [Ferruginibacter sp.]